MQRGGKKSKAKKANKNDGDKQGVKPPNPGAVYFNTLFEPVIGLVQAEMQSKIDDDNGDIHVTRTQARTLVYNQGELVRSVRKAKGIMNLAEAFVLDWKNDEFFYNGKFQDPFNSTAHMPRIVQQLLSYIQDKHPMIYSSFGADDKERALYLSERDYEARIAMNEAYDDWVRVFGDKDDDSLGGGDDDDFMHEPPMAKNKFSMAKNELRMAENGLPMAKVVGIVVNGEEIPIDNGAAAPVPPSSPPPPGVGKVSAPVEQANETESEDDTGKPVGKQGKQPDSVIKVKVEQVTIKPDPDGAAGGAADGAANGAANTRKRARLTPEEKQRRVEARPPDNEVIEILD